MTSVSVWLSNTNPCDSSSRRSAAWFSITPLCTRATVVAARAAAQVGMGIAIGRRPVSRPSRVTDPAGARRRLALEQLFERPHPTGSLPHNESVAVDRRQPGAVVTTILEPPQTRDQDRRSLMLSGVPDNPAHRLRSLVRNRDA